MAERTHYDTLGLNPGATDVQIKAAYRKLARELHPDVNPKADALASFHCLQESYEVLSDARRKEAYDAILAARSSRDKQNERATKQRAEEEELQRRAQERMRDAPPPPKIDLEETRRLTSLLNGGSFVEAERLANVMIHSEPRQPVPYAVLGDIERVRGNYERAMRNYGFAAQYEPRNTVYQRKYEEMMNAQSVSTERRASGRYVPEVSLQPVFVGGLLVVLMAVYVALAPEKPLGLAFAMKWSMGTLVMLFLSGIVTGSVLSLAKVMAPFDAAAGSAMMRVPPSVALGILSVVSFWLCCVLYLIVGQTQQAFNRSLSLLLGSVAGNVGLFALAGLAKGPELAVQNLVWGGNLAYFGALAGWFVTDSLRPR